MKILSYMQLERGGGVARHCVEMVNRLFSRPGISGSIFASGFDLKRNPRFPSDYPGIPWQTHPWPGVWLERSWKLAGWPPLAARCRSFDVIYSPAEVRLPRCGVPSIVTIHDVHPLEEDLPWSRSAAHRQNARRWRAWLPKVFDEASLVVTVSEFSKQRMVSLLGVDPNRIAVIGNGVSPVFFEREQEDPAAATPSVVIVGGLRSKKGAEEVLSVAAELRRRRSPLVIDVCGVSDPEWQSRAASHANIRFHGVVPDAELAAKLRRSTALLFLSPYEGFGIPALEAMAAGTPAVVADSASLPEVAGDAGIVVDRMNSKLAADVLERLSEDLAFRSRLVAAGRVRAAKFTWESCVDRLLVSIRSVRIAGQV